MAVKQVTKRMLSMLLVLCLVIGSMIILGPQEAHAGQTNLVTNGGFDTVDGWNNTSTDPAVPVAAQSADQAYETVYLLNEDFSGETYSSYLTKNGNSTLTLENGALKVTGSSTGTGVRVHNLPVVAGQTYTISFDVKIDTAGMMTNYYTRSMTGTASAVEKYYSAKALTGACDWKNITIEYTVPAGKDCVQFIIYNNNLAADYIFWIDNLSISSRQEKVDVIRNYVVNEDFSGETYSSYLMKNGNSALAVENGALKVTGNSKGTGVKAHNIPVTAGQTYIFSFDIKIDTPGMMTNYYTRSILSANGSAIEKYYSAKALTGACDWRNITIEYTVPDGKDCVQFIIYDNNLTADYTFWIDNFAMYTEESHKVYSYTEGIGNCGGEEPNNVLVMKEMTKVSYGVLLEAGKEYTYSYKVKTEGTAGVTFSAGTQEVKTSSAADWDTVTGKFTAESAQSNISFTRTGEGSVFIDDVELYAGETPTEPIDVNISFRAAYPQDTWIQMQINVTNEEAIAALKDNTKVYLETEIDGVKQKVSWHVMKNSNGTRLFPHKSTVETIPIDAKTVTIYAGTLSSLSDPASQSNYVPFRIANDLTMSKVNGTWIEGKPEDIKPVKTTISKQSLLAEKEAYRLHLKVSNYEELVAEYGLWSWFEGELKIDGKPTKVRFNLGSGVFATFKSDQNPTAVIPLDITTIVIPAGTEFKDLDGSSARLLVTENELHMNLGKPVNPDVYNDVKLTFESTNGQAGIYVKAEIVAGPDKGKIIGTEAYGNWKSGGIGDASYSADNKTAERKVSYSPVNDTIYISGFPELSTLDAITLKEGTVITPKDTAQNTTPMRLVNTLELVREKEYGRWGVKGQVQTPTSFRDVVISIQKINATSVTLIVESADGSKKTLDKIYGKGAKLSGSAEVVHPTKGAYTDENIVYQVQADGKVSLCVDLVYLDSVEVKEGTIWWPAASSEDQIPVRVKNRIYMDRDEEDEWVIRVGAAGTVKTTGTGSNGGPKSGDDTPIGVYTGILVIAAISTSVCVYLKKKRRQSA